MAILLVTDARLGSATSVIRSLGRAGHRVVAVDSRSFSAGLRSRHAWRSQIVPPAETAPVAYADRIVDLIARHAIDAVVPITDASLIPLAGRRAELGAILGVAPDWALDQTRDKAATIRLARGLGIPTPRTVVVRDVAHARAAVAELGWPVVIKPRWSRVVMPDGSVLALEVTYANDQGELQDRMRPITEHTDVLLQTYHPGVGIGVELLMAEGRLIAAFQHRRIREVPVTGGASAYRESVPLDPDLLRHTTAFLGALRWTGLAMAEFKVDAEGAQLLEVNGRIWGSLPLAVKSGMDFPALYADLLLGRLAVPRRAMTDYRIGVRSRNLSLELVWVASVLRGRRRYPYLAAPTRREGLEALFALLAPSSEHDILSLDDPVPGLVDLVAATHHVAAKVLRGG